jgi:DNA primase
VLRIPQTELERLKNEVSVQRLVEVSGIELKKAGKDWLGRCPFHQPDTEPSLVVSPGKNLWHSRVVEELSPVRQTFRQFAGE